MTHEPERCLTLSGKIPQADYGVKLLTANGVTFPLRTYCFSDSGTKMFVFFCYWHEGTAAELNRQSAETVGLHPRLVAAWSGNRALGRGLRSLEFSVVGYENEEQAAEKLKQVLAEIIVTEKSGR